MTMMISRLITIIRLPRRLRACIYATLLCAFFGAVADTRAQSKDAVCAVLDLTDQNCAQIDSISYEPPQRPWTITVDYFVAGGSSLRRAAIGHNQSSCIVLEVSLPVNSVISVAGRTSSEGGFDQLQIDADNLRLDTISAPVDQIERDWRQQSYFLPTAISTLSWCYTKNDAQNNGQDTAWIDNLSFSASNIPHQNRICEALDLTDNRCSLIQSIRYEPPELLWIITPQTSVVGRTSMRSADIGDSQQSCLVLELSLPANSVISVAGRTSSEGGADQLQVIADNLRLDTIAAPINQSERDWRQQSYFLPTAISTLSWCYVKSDSQSRGQDAAWVDNLSFDTLNSYQSRVCDALDLTAGDCLLIQSVSYEPPQRLWVVTPETSIAGGSSLRSADIGDSQQSCIVFEVSLPANSVISVAGRTSSEGGEDQLQINANNLRLDTLSALWFQTERNWRLESYFLPTAISTLSWCYVKSDSQSRGQDAAWIDNLSFSTSNIPYQNRICAALDLTVGDCSLIQSIRYEPPELLWIITSQTSVVGRTSMRSVDIGDSQQSCLVLELSLPANSVISVAGRTSSEGGADQLQVIADNLRLNTIAAPINQSERDWRQQSYFLPTAISTLSWCYVKSDSQSRGQDAAWVDNLSFDTLNSYQSRVCAALDLTAGDCSLIQSISYEPPQRLWVITPETSIAGGSSLRSADIGDSQQSCIVFEVSLPANSVISVAGRTSSRGGFHQLQINADNLRIDTISATFHRTERDWRLESYFLPTAISTLSWCYTKNDEQNSGQDAAWIDNLSFSTSNISYQSRVCDALDLTSGDCSLIQSIRYEPPQSLWIITSETSVVGGSSLRSADIVRDQQSCLVLELSLPANSVISVAGRTNSEGFFDQLQIDADSLRLDTISALFGHTEKGWRLESYLLPTAISALRWCYTKNNSGDRGQDAAWIDNLSFDTPDSYQNRICAALDLTDQNCAQIDSITYEPPRRAWTITMDTFVSGDSSLRSPDISENQQSCLMLEVSLPTNSVISVASRTRARGGRDQLQIAANNLRLDTIFAPRDWRLESYFLPIAISTLFWCYDNRNGGRGEDAAWIDNLSFSTSNISYQSRICAALDLTNNHCSLIQSIRYEPPDLLWIITSETSVVGRTSMHSGGNSCLVLEVSLPANSVISVAGRTVGVFSRLQIDADNLRLDTISAPFRQTERDWKQQSYFLPTAISTLSWCSNARSAWIDNLSIGTLDSYQSRVCDALDLTAGDCSQIQSISYEPPQRLWVITPETSIAGGSSLRSADIDDDQSSCLVLELSLPANSVISVAGRTSSQGFEDRLQIDADDLRIDIISAEANQTERNWRQQSYFLPTAVSTLRWCYAKSRVASEGQDAAWIDSLSFDDTLDLYLSRFCAALDLTAGDCSQIQSISFEPPLRLWVITPETSIAGGSSLRSGDIDDSQQSCLVLEVSLPVNSVISVAGRTSSQGGADQLQVIADNLRLDTISAEVNQTERDWRLESYFLPTAISTLSWCYAKDGSDDTGKDAAWIDNLSFSTSNISYQRRICEALDLTTGDCSMIQSIRYEPPELLWIITSQTSVVGRTSLRSGDIGLNQQSCLVLEVSLLTNSVISVAGRTSSQGGRDQLQVIADNLRLDTLSAPVDQTERDWSQESYFLPAAITMLRWCYAKNDGDTFGFDAAWIDNLSFSTSNIPYQSRICDALDVTAGDCSLIQSITYNPPELLWIITSQTSVVGRTSLRSADIDRNQQSCLVLEVSLPTNSVISVAGRTSSQGGEDQLQVIVDNLRLDTLSAPHGQTERDWRLESYFLPTAISTLSWCYAKSRFTVQGQDAAWIDNLSFSTSNIPYQSRICDALDVTAGDCSLIQSITYHPPELLWIITSQTSVVGRTSLRSADIDRNQQSCIVLEVSLPANSEISVAARTSSEGGRDQLQIFAGDLHVGTISAPNNLIERDWRQQSYLLPTAISTLSWCYAKNNTSDRGQDAAWIDNLLLIALANRYRVEIAVSSPVITATPPNSFQFQVTVTAVSPILPPPLDWVLIASGIDNIASADTTYTLVFSDNSARVDVVATPDNPLLPSSLLLALEDRLLLHSASVTTLTVRLPNTRRLAVLELVVALRWLIDQQRSTESLVVNLTMPSTGVMTAGIDNLQQLFMEDIDRIDVNRDGRTDHLDLRILVRYMSGLPDAALSDRQIRKDLIRSLLAQPRQTP